QLDQAVANRGVGCTQGEPLQMADGKGLLFLRSGFADSNGVQARPVRPDTEGHYRWIRPGGGLGPLQDRQGGGGGRLAQVEPRDVANLAHCDSPNKGCTVSVKHAWMSAWLNTASMASSKEQRYSCRNQRSPSAWRSSARNPGGMRGHCSAVTFTRS